MHPEGPATGHLDTDFLGFPLSLSKCLDVTKFQVATACLNSSKLTPVIDSADLIVL
jgi:hypothetical protein